MRAVTFILTIALSTIGCGGPLGSGGRKSDDGDSCAKTADCTLGAVCTNQICTAEGTTAGTQGTTGTNSTGPATDTAILNRSELVRQNLATSVALTHYRSFETLSAEMAEQCSAFCANPNADTLAAARESWKTARKPWKRAEVIKFGPVVEYPLRLGPKLDNWPVNSGAVEKLVAADGPVDVEAFALMGLATRGLPVVEYLLWGNGQDTLNELSSDSRRCGILVGAAGDVHANAKALGDEWESVWVLHLTDPQAAEDPVYKDPDAVVDEWVNRMGFTIENIRVMKLGKPMGDKSNGEVQPHIIESRPSGASLVDAQDALAGVYDVWTGEVGDGSAGISELVQDGQVLSKVHDLFQTAKSDLEAIPETLEQSITDSRASVEKAQESLRLLQIAIQSDVADAIGTTITFNDADGD